MTSFNKRVPVNFSFDDSQYQSFTNQAKLNSESGSIRQFNTGFGFELDNVMLNRRTRHNGLAATRFRTLN
ncbi:MAG: hypothetical protein CTY18_05820 [Methylomonas sp.]|nr:MAG: hypothetical protein CTY24_13600 [Methylobacter sp.]PPD35994.1 MAG: hypothetical protein CTY18_05820 [Methylomonas sp.]